MGEFQGKNQLLTKKNTKACLELAKKNLDYSLDLWEDILETEKTTVEPFGMGTSC